MSIKACVAKYKLNIVVQLFVHNIVLTISQRQAKNVTIEKSLYAILPMLCI